MATVTEVRTNHKLIVLNMVTGATFQVERLPRQLARYARGFRLTQLYTGAAVAPVCQTHQLACGLQECDCPDWVARRACPHVEMLIGAGLFEEPVLFGPPEPRGRDSLAGFPEDELVEIEWQSEAP